MEKKRNIYTFIVAFFSISAKNYNAQMFNLLSGGMYGRTASNLFINQGYFTVIPIQYQIHLSFTIQHPPPPPSSPSISSGNTNRADINQIRTSAMAIINHRAAREWALTGILPPSKAGKEGWGYDRPYAISATLTKAAQLHRVTVSTSCCFLAFVLNFTSSLMHGEQGQYSRVPMPPLVIMTVGLSC